MRRPWFDRFLRGLSKSGARKMRLGDAVGAGGAFVLLAPHAARHGSKVARLVGGGERGGVKRRLLCAVFKTLPPLIHAAHGLGRREYLDTLRDAG